MTRWLKQSTAADVVIGPFVDDTDGKTPETALTISQADCQLIKNGGAAAQKNDATAASHLAGGHYKVPLNTTDTNTLGQLRLYVNESGALPVWGDFMIVPATVWNDLFGATPWGGLADAVWDEATSGHTTAGTTGKAVTDANNGAPPTAAAIADAVWDESMEGHLSIGTTGATLEDAASFFPEWAEDIADAVWDEALSGHTTAGTAGKALDDAGGASSLTAGAVADAVWDEAAVGHVTDGTMGRYLDFAAKGSYVDNNATAAANLKTAFTGGTYNAAGLSVAAAAAVSGTVAANLVNVGSSATLYAALVALIQAAVPGTVVSGTNTSTVVSTGLASTTTGRYVGKTLVVTSGTRAGEGGKLVTAYDGATKQLTVEAMTGALTAGDTFVLVG